jgi:acyl carrier protein
MTGPVDASHSDELEIHPAGERMPVSSTLLTRDRVVAEIVRTACAIRPSFSERDLNGETNLALDLGLESASRVELLLEVERALDIALDVGEVAVFAELTIADLAHLIMPKIHNDEGTSGLPTALS